MLSPINKMKRSILATLLVFSLISTVDSAKLSPADKDIRANIVHKIHTYYKSIGIRVDEKVIDRTLFAIDKYRFHYFPELQFGRQDFIAFAMVESNFHQYEKGKFGEVGIFQVMPVNISKNIKNPFSVDSNTKLAMKVLQEKMREHKSYKKSIIAYNGLVYRHGKLSEKYWDLFKNKKNILIALNIE